MTHREFFLQRRTAEVPVFLRVLTALPSDQLSYKPHERCSSAQEIVATLTGAKVPAIYGPSADERAM